jgi:hypothetical protein
MKYAWIRDHRRDYPVTVVSSVLEVSPAGFYDWLNRKPSSQHPTRQTLEQAVERSHADSHQVYGYRKVHADPYFLGKQTNNANSTSNFMVEVNGRNMPGLQNVNLEIKLSASYNENNFTWKNLVVELYNSGDINDPANRLGVYDAKDLASGKVVMPTLQVSEGLSYQLVIKPRNYADFNLDNSVDLADLAILSENWLSADPNEFNTWDEYTDIDRNGTVGISDLVIFVSQWLFKGVDPGTISSLDPIRNDEPENILRTRNQWAVDNRLRIPV